MDNDKMTWEQYKIEAAKFANYPKENEENYLYNGFMAEVGEVYGVHAKYFRGDYNEQERNRLLRKEFGDVMWFVAMVENTGHKLLQDKEFSDVIDRLNVALSWFEWNIEEIYAENIAKLTDRSNRNVIQGSGDDR